jgi:hypothetical protein
MTRFWMRSKFAQAGVKVSAKSIQKVAEEFLSGARKSFRVPGASHAHVEIEITYEDIVQIEKAIDGFQYDTVLRTLSDDLSNSTFRNLRRGWKKEFSAQQIELTEFRTRLERRWGKALGKLRMLLTLAREWSQSMVGRKQKNGKLSQYDDVILRLYVRACQVVGEIIILLENGYADGAMARWRTLHEIATVAAVISHFGPEIAERYVQYQIVEAYRSLLAYDRNYKALGYRPATKKRAAKTKSDFDAALLKYGKPFGKEYGWAVSYLKKDHITFAMLEEVARAEHMRSHYKLASSNVHAGPKGIYTQLGQMGGSNVFLAGPSNAGLFEPAQNAAVTLTRLSTLICGKEWTLDDIVLARIMMLLMNEIPLELQKADDKLQRDEKRVRQAKRRKKQRRNKVGSASISDAT